MAAPMVVARNMVVAEEQEELRLLALGLLVALQCMARVLEEVGAE